MGVGDPAGPARGHTRQPPAHVIAAAQLCFLGDEQAQKRLADVAKTNDREIIRRDGLALSELVCRCSRQFCRCSRDEHSLILQDTRDNNNSLVGLLPMFLLDGFADGGYGLRRVAGIKTRGVELVFEPGTNWKAVRGPWVAAAPEEPLGAFRTC